MAVAEIAAPQPGERVLDLCAAPGGKTSHLASLAGDQCLLISNEIHPQRARILSRNVERMGICNAAVLNETPDRLAERFSSFLTASLWMPPVPARECSAKNRWLWRSGARRMLPSAPAGRTRFSMPPCRCLLPAAG